MICSQEVFNQIPKKFILFRTRRNPRVYIILLELIGRRKYHEDSQEVLVLGLLESEIFKGDIRPNLCVCLFVCVWIFVKLGLCTKREKCIQVRVQLLIIIMVKGQAWEQHLYPLPITEVADK